MMTTKTAESDLADARLAQVREFWEHNVHDWKVAKSDVGTAAFFRETEEYRFEKLHYLPKLVDFNGFAGQRLLDLGCGVGNDLSRFAKGGAQVVGVDLAAHSIELAKANFEQRGLTAEFFVMNGEKLEFEDNSFDVVYCHTVLHFTPDPAAMVHEIHRVLKPGGLAIIMTVNRRSWLNLLHKVMKVQIDHLDSPVFHRYTIGQFRSLLAPFRHVEIVPERFPVATKVHEGWKAKAFNLAFVRVFNLIPRPLVRRTGHHLMAFARKEDA
ncbi:MAG: class I SAM-dependent methyltransferase [Gemmatimonadota bacterium]|nr:MAG: class I SAM-dependent methyltransferase [Gemmatimonadota bacterium]